MKEVLRSHSISYAQAMQLALEAEGIEALLLDENAPGYLGFAGRVRLAVAHEEDHPRAMEVVRKLQPRSFGSPIPASWRWQRTGLLGIVAGFAMLLVSHEVADGVSGGVARGLMATAIGLIVAGVILVLVGPLRDRWS